MKRTPGPLTNIVGRTNYERNVADKDKDKEEKREANVADKKEQDKRSLQGNIARQ